MPTNVATRGVGGRRRLTAVWGIGRIRTFLEQGIYNIQRFTVEVVRQLDFRVFK